jgi:hypothetical protein
MTDDRDRRLHELVNELRASVDAEIVRERRVVTPDFAAVVAAARARDPEAVSEAAVREAGELAPIVELGAELSVDRHASGAELSDAQLDTWIAAARALAEEDVAARRLAGVPPLSGAPAPSHGWGRGWGRGWATAVAVAAILIGVAIAVTRLLHVFVDGNYREAESAANQAEYLGPEASPEGDLRLRPEPAPVEPVLQQAIQHQALPPEPLAESLERAPASRAGAIEQRDRQRGRQRDRQRDRIGQLDAEAQARWAEGDLAGAEQRFRAIIELGGRSRYADLAYGDLFTLARQRDDQAEERSLWQEYLERFPTGRFADDARAGLCRRGVEAERGACWRAYLDDFPQGVHTRAAERILGLP